MKSVNLGSQGLRVPAIGLGCMGMSDFYGSSSQAENLRVLDRAVDIGCTFWDTSDIYGPFTNEILLSKSLKGRRDQIILATKFGVSRGEDGSWLGIKGNADYVKACCDASLKRLGTDYIDLYYQHRVDPETPIEETVGAMAELVEAGKVRYIGSSTAPAWKVMEAVLMSGLKGYVRFVSEQPPYNLLDRRIENELVPMCQAHGLGIFPWSPLAMGILAGRYADADDYPADSRANLRGGIYAERITARGIEVGNRVVHLARERGISPAQLAVLWVKDQPGVTAPLIGPRTVEQLEQMLPVLEMELDAETRQACDELVPPGSAAANFHNSAPWMKMRVL